MDYLETIKNKKNERADAKFKDDSVNASKELANELRTLLESLEKTGAKTLDKDFVEAVKNLHNIAKQMSNVKVTSDQDIKRTLEAMVTLFATMQVSPIVKVEPNITVESPKVDTTGIENAMTKFLKPEKEVDLDDYKAQDLDEITDGLQVVGMLHPCGAWYMIENDVQKQTLRYKFGKKGYKKAWENRTQTKYKLLDEAIREVQT